MVQTREEILDRMIAFILGQDPQSQTLDEIVESLAIRAPVDSFTKQMSRSVRQHRSRRAGEDPQLVWLAALRARHRWSLVARLNGQGDGGRGEVDEVFTCWLMLN